MRDIKFRAWDVRSGCMCSVKSILYLSRNDIRILGYAYDKRIDASISQGQTPLEGIFVILMQYIGIKDKNGKEVYEGDITNRGIVEWNDHLNWDMGGSYHPGFYFKSSDDEGDLSYHLGFDDRIEVIGNIYENPKLREII